MLCRRIALLAAGDLAVLLAFAAIGRHNHGEPLALADTFSTALPFIIGKPLDTVVGFYQPWNSSSLLRHVELAGKKCWSSTMLQ